MNADLPAVRGLRLDVSTLDDAVLLTLIAGGRRGSAPTEALGVLYDRYGRLVYTIAIHVVGDAETAEEITQDVFVRVWEGAGSYRSEMAKVSSWLISITRHRAIDELRRRGSRPEKDSIAWPEDIGMESTDGMPLLDGPENTVENSIVNHSVRQVMEMLPPDQRKILGLAFFKGLSHSQIADELGEPLGTVKSRIRLAMHKLRDAMIERGIYDQ